MKGKASIFPAASPPREASGRFPLMRNSQRGVASRRRGRNTPIRLNAHFPRFSFTWRKGARKKRHREEDAHFVPALLFLECPFYLR
ncbi:hypothetical protein CesoFtcFv8_023755 [Champsocephalus esox]|uniref:Uncharacterized protein n=1 Tax=Champsocephalus esox TaxID=159716 RepID=A0AAN8B535_9TELE|nr:hypothetical protein CesoFtcFv8_023755 [Champsocephalus esox]